MHIETKVIVNGSTLAILMREEAKQRLATKCFRGQLVEKAGNFRHWECVEEVFSHDHMRTRFTEQIVARVIDGSANPVAVTIECVDPIGWESTIPVNKIDPGDLKEFQINTHAKGLRVLPGRCQAPKTSVLTAICEIRHETSHGSPKYTVVIHSMYPGTYIGKLDGDVSTREGRVFFDWENPGVPWR
jgi:hypothetical protein